MSHGFKFSVLNGIGDIASEQPERVTGGFDIKASVSSELPIQGQIEDSLNMNDYSSVFGSSSLDVEIAENIGAELSIINVLDSFNELAEPGRGRDRILALPRISTIFPSLKDNALSLA